MCLRRIGGESAMRDVEGACGGGGRRPANLDDEMREKTRGDGGRAASERTFISH